MNIMKLLQMTIIFLFICSCKNDFYMQQKNQESDKREGEMITGIYFDNLLLEQPHENIDLFSSEFFKITSKEKFIEQNEFIKNKLGKVLGKELKQWETSIISGTNPKSEYLFIYNVQREKYNSVETFYLMKDEATDSIKIYSYKIESEGLLTTGHVSHLVMEGHVPKMLI